MGAGAVSLGGLTLTSGAKQSHLIQLLNRCLHLFFFICYLILVGAARSCLLSTVTLTLPSIFASAWPGEQLSVAPPSSRGARRSALVEWFLLDFEPFLLTSSRTVDWLTPSALAACRWVSPASTSFFAVSNYAVWVGSGMYPHTLGGLSACYASALPFYRNDLISTLLVTGIAFGGEALLRRSRGAHAASHRRIAA